jgi:MtN3 and saliva related transmembrane protein
MSGLNLLGLLAACCTTFAFLPQLLKVFRTRSTKDISLSTFLILVLGIVLWLIYGTMREDLPIVTANAVTLAFAGAILYCKLKYG